MQGQLHPRTCSRLQVYSGLYCEDMEDPTVQQPTAMHRSPLVRLHINIKEPEVPVAPPACPSGGPSTGC